MVLSTELQKFTPLSDFVVVVNCCFILMNVLILMKEDLILYSMSSGLPFLFRERERERERERDSCYMYMPIFTLDLKFLNVFLLFV